MSTEEALKGEAKDDCLQMGRAFPEEVVFELRSERRKKAGATGSGQGCTVRRANIRGWSLDVSVASLCRDRRKWPMWPQRSAWGRGRDVFREEES